MSLKYKLYVNPEEIFHEIDEKLTFDLIWSYWGQKGPRNMAPGAIFYIHLKVLKIKYPMIHHMKIEEAYAVLKKLTDDHEENR